MYQKEKMSFAQLPPLEVLDISLDTLRPIDLDTSYHIPALLNKPQNPILDTLRFWKAKAAAGSSRLWANGDATSLGSSHTLYKGGKEEESADPIDSDLWLNALTRPVAQVSPLSVYAQRSLI